VRIIIKCPESDSPLKGRIHLGRLSLRLTSNLLQSGGGPYIIVNYPGGVGGFDSIAPSIGAGYCSQRENEMTAKSPAPKSSAPQSKKPNVVYFLVDNLGMAN
jgi:hypothetical protein